MLSILDQDAIQFDMPEGACDCHTHIFGPVQKYPYWADRTYTPADASLSQLEQLHHHLGISRIVIVHPSPYGTDNTRSIDALIELGSKSRGVAVIDENTCTTEQIEKLHQVGFRGARLNLETTGIDDPVFAKNKLFKTAQLIKAFGWHIQIFSNIHLVTQLAQEIIHCEVPVVLDHFARIPIGEGINQPKVQQLCDMFTSGNVWMKLSAPQRIHDNPDSEEVAKLASLFITNFQDRLVWGSDWPHSGAHYGRGRVKEEIEPFHHINDGHSLNRLFHWVKDQSLMKKILVDNPTTLYDFPKT